MEQENASSLLQEMKSREFNFQSALKELRERDSNIQTDNDLATEQFAKLKFNYVEMETKKVFLESLGAVDKQSWRYITPQGQGETAVKRSLKELKKHNSELRTQLASLVETVDSLFEQRSILLDRVQKDTDSHSALQRQHTESREALAHQTHQLGGMTLEEAELQLHNGLRDVQQVDADLSDESAALALLQAQIEEAEADVRKSIHVLQARQECTDYRSKDQDERQQLLQLKESLSSRLNVISEIGDFRLQHQNENVLAFEVISATGKLHLLCLRIQPDSSFVSSATLNGKDFPLQALTSVKDAFVHVRRFLNE